MTASSTFSNSSISSTSSDGPSMSPVSPSESSFMGVNANDPFAQYAKILYEHTRRQMDVSFSSAQSNKDRSEKSPGRRMDRQPTSTSTAVV